MSEKAKRSRDWKSNQKKPPKKSDVVNTDGAGEVTGYTKGKATGQFLDWLYQYAQDMHTWGQDVRDDIIRLEGQAGFPSGDPGDPPDGPPNGDD